MPTFIVLLMAVLWTRCPGRLSSFMEPWTFVLLLGTVAATGIPQDASGQAPLEDLFEWRARDPNESFESPARLLKPAWLADHGAGIVGWVEFGIGSNSLGSDFNGPVALNDRAWQGMLQQLGLIGHKPLTDEFAWGARVDLLYGTDWWTAVARGSRARIVNVSSPSP